MRQRSKRRDAQAISHHYDVSNDFYALFLDPLMLYTCAYYREPDGKLEQAQEDKVDLVCRKLRLKPDETLLDIGCGWGGLSIWAAQHYGVIAHGVTLSRAQADLCWKFAKSDHDSTRFDGVEWTAGPTGSPIIDRAVAWIDCETEQVHEMGDHYFVLGRVVGLEADPHHDDPTGPHPLLFFKGTLGGRMFAAPDAGLGQHADQMIEMFRLQHVAHLDAGTLSYGQQKLIDIAMAFMPAPRLVLLDEPCAGVNPSLVDQLHDRLVDLNKTQGGSFVVIEHNMDFIMKLCPHVICMVEGKVLAEGPPAEVQSNRQVLEAYLGN